MEIRDRITELRRVKASDLAPNPKNWRRHPEQQTEALRAILDEVGYADALLARETDDGLVLIDGHLRAETTPEAVVPVLVLDVNEEEADKILVTLDPVAAMAETDYDALGVLLEGIRIDDDALSDMLDAVSGQETTPTRFPVLPEGERPNIGQMTFTVSAYQRNLIEEAVKRSKADGQFEGTGNENSNGNAIARICQSYLE